MKNDTSTRNPTYPFPLELIDGLGDAKGALLDGRVIVSRGPTQAVTDLRIAAAMAAAVALVEAAPVDISPQLNCSKLTT